MCNNIRLIIFDLDGVLVNARDIHYEALNKALYDISPKYTISREEHLSTYDGLNTSKKLHMLTKEKGLPLNVHQDVWEAKQKATSSIIDRMEVDMQKKFALSKLKESGYTLAVASNSIRQSLKMMLVKTGLIEHIDFYYSNQDVIKPKPSPEIYLRCILKSGFTPKETLIIEDSPHGREAALSSGANVMTVRGPEEVTHDNIVSFIKGLTSTVMGNHKWQDKKMNIVIPMAGRGSRFAEVGYSFPKPLIEVLGKPMIQLAVENINIDAHYIFIVQKEHYDKYNLKALLNLITPGCDIIVVEGVTEGAACSVLLAQHLIDNENPLITANSDQFLYWSSSDFMWSMTGDNIDGGIVTFHATHPKWSFAKVGNDGFITEVAEKNPISEDATVGVYYWRKGSDYVKYANQMIEKDLRVNGEFYVAPVFNESIQDGKKIKNYHIDKFSGIGTPEDLQTFLQNYK